MERMVSSIAIIPARSGSKRIPGKNIKLMNGKPLIAWTIEAALGAGCFDRVLVSTDSEEIAGEAEKSGCEVPFLRVENADDHAMSSAATLTALEQAEQYFSEEYEIVSQLMPTTPLRSDEHIRQAYDHFLSNNNNAQISCTRFTWQNPWWSVTLDENGKPKALFEDKKLQRSQDLVSLYCPTGAVWIARTEIFKKEQTFYTSQHVYHPIDWIAGIDIDTLEDFVFVERMMTGYRN